MIIYSQSSAFLVRDLLSLVPPTAALAGFTYITYRAFCPHGRPAPTSKVNLKILKSEAKVVDSVDIEDISEKAVFCRCWRSKNVVWNPFVSIFYLHNFIFSGLIVMELMGLTTEKLLIM